MELTDQELETLLEVVIERVRRDLFDGKPLDQFLEDEDKDLGDEYLD